jgi:hypothetical protein
MKGQTQETLKKFEQDHEIYVNATEALTYWVIYAKIPRVKKEDLHNVHIGKRYVTGPNEDGNVLIFPDPMISDAYMVESWGRMDTIDDFVKKALTHILSEKDAPESGNNEGCGSSCS